MAQYYQLSIPRAKGVLGFSGELSTILFDGSPGELVSLLLVPPNPAQKAPSPPAAPAIPEAPTELRVRNSSSRVDAESLSQSAASVVVGSQDHRITFCTLPLEIHLLIFDYLDDRRDLTCVGKAVPYLWGITQEIVHQRYLSRFGAWAGENIVCAGEETAPGNYPPGLFSAEEEKYLNKMFLVPIRKSKGRYGGRKYKYRNEGDKGSIPLNLYDMSKSPGARFYCDVSDELKLFSSGGQAWILRNLTTKEFVTASSIALDPEFIRGPFISGIGFGEVVMMRTCWSSMNDVDLFYSAQVGLSYNEPIHRGVWAGHRFDITTRKQHDESMQGEEGEWKDVSEDVAREIAAIWEIKYGPSWENICICSVYL